MHDAILYFVPGFFKEKQITKEKDDHNQYFRQETNIYANHNTRMNQ